MLNLKLDLFLLNMYLSLCAYILKSVLQGEQKLGLFFYSSGHNDCMSKGSIVVGVHLTLKPEYKNRQFYSIFLKKNGETDKYDLKYPNRLYCFALLCSSASASMSTKSRETFI